MSAVEKIPLVRLEAPRESHFSAEDPSARSVALQPPDRAGVPTQRRFSAVLGLQLTYLGRQVPGLLVLSTHAVPHRADEENRPHPAHSPGAAAQLFQGPEPVLKRGHRGPKQQGQSNHEKILRLPHLPHPGTRAVSLTWQTARTGAYPRILLTSHIYLA